MSKKELEQLAAAGGEANPAYWGPKVLSHIQTQERAIIELTKALIAVRNRLDKMEMTHAS